MATKTNPLSLNPQLILFKSSLKIPLGSWLILSWYQKSGSYACGIEKSVYSSEEMKSNAAFAALSMDTEISH